MGTDIYELTVVSRDAKTGKVAIKVKYIYDPTEKDWDENNCLCDLGFAFQIMHNDYLYQFSNGGDFGPGYDRSQKPTVLPPLADEVGVGGMVSEEWLMTNVRAFISLVEYDRSETTLYITPTHHGWTEQFVVGEVCRSASYTVKQPNEQHKYRPCDPLSPIDRSVPPQPTDDDMAGFEFKIAKDAQRRAQRRKREEAEKNNEEEDTKKKKKKVASSVEQPTSSAPPSAGGWGGWGSNATSATATTTTAAVSGFGTNSGWGAPAGQGNSGFGSFGAAAAAPAASSSNSIWGTNTGFGFGAPSGMFGNDLRDPAMEAPDHELLIPTQPASKYCVSTRLDHLAMSVADLAKVCAPVMHLDGFGMRTGELEIGNIISLEKGKCVIYFEGDCASGFRTIPEESVRGRAMLMKPRPRVGFN